MSPRTYEVEFDGGVLQRGFWLYVWVVRTSDATEMLYVGRTGDSSSINAQSPFARMAQHLGFAKTSMMLRKHLDRRSVDPRVCSFRLVAHGPVLQESEGRDVGEHRARRDVVAAYERALCEALCASGYDVMNTVKCRKPLDAAGFEAVRSAFAVHFPALTTGPNGA